MKNRVWFSLGVVLVICGFAGMGYAYYVPSQYIVKTWVNKHASAKTVRVRSIVTAYEGDKPTPVHFRETSVFYSDAQVFRSSATDDQKKDLFTLEKSASTLPLVTKLLLSHDVKGVTELMREKGIPVRTEEDLLKLKTEAERIKAEREFFVRWEQRVALAIGPGSPNEIDTSEPQAWFDKDTFFPVRLIYPSTSDRETYEYRFENFQTFKGNEIPFPGLVKVMRKGETILSVQLIDVAINADHLTKSGQKTGFTDAGDSAPSAVKDLIRFYYNHVR